MKSQTDLTPEAVARALSRFANLRGRGGVAIAFSPFGPVVEAITPAELEAATDAAIITATKTETPS